MPPAQPGRCALYSRRSQPFVGYAVGLYLQDEWRLTDRITLNAGLRFDQYWEYISEYQLSPRVSLTWKPFDSTTFHAGYARTFTPPEQVLAAPTNLALFANTTQQPSVPIDDPVRAERADVYDVGVVQQILPGLEAGSTPTTRRRPISSTTASSAPPMCSPRSTMRRAKISASSFPPSTRADLSRLTAILPWRARSLPSRSRNNFCSITRRRSPISVA